MKFEHIFVEKDVFDHPRTKTLLSKLSSPTVTEIDRYDDIFGRARKPYLHKRTNLNAFIAKKRGTLIKEAPAAYGTQEGSHYYFIHQFNCIYECEYCYLQGYFNSPDLVFFVNHEDITRAIAEQVSKASDSELPMWFHAGEFSDSLAINGLTNEWPLYWDLFAKLPEANLELRTKSVNIRWIAQLAPLPNITISFSIASHQQSQRFDRNTPPMMARIKAIKTLANLGHSIGLHCDPIIFCEDFELHYRQMIQDLAQQVDLTQLAYISVGVVRFTKDVMQQMNRHYPDSKVTHRQLTANEDGKFRYAHPMRMNILNTVRQLWIDAGAPDSKIYLCMEEN
jgi:spore photoproduct lyase